MDTTAATHYNAAVPYTLGGSVAVDGLIPSLGVQILTQPVSQTVVEPNSASFTVVAFSGDGSPMTYQWQQLIAAVWTNMTNTPPFSGVLTATMTINPTDYPVDNGLQFRVLVTNAVNTATSVQASLTVTAAETFYILAQSGDFLLAQNGLDKLITQAAP